MNLSNPARSMLGKVPGLNAALDKILSRLNAIWSTEHTPEGAHGVIHERGRPFAIGEPVDIPFLAGNFYAATGAVVADDTWTLTKADQVSLWYVLDGSLMTLHFSLQTTTVGVNGTGPLELRIKLPIGFLTGSNQSIARISAVDAGVDLTLAVAVVSQGKNYISCYVQYSSLALGFWQASTNQTELYGSISFPIAAEPEW